MNDLEENDSEFVEVDPSGRYGRVSSLLSIKYIYAFTMVSSQLECNFCLILLLQYNEILGKGASKTVYDKCFFLLF